MIKKTLDFIGDGDADAPEPDGDPMDNCSDSSHGNLRLFVLFSKVLLMFPYII